MRFLQYYQLLERCGLLLLLRLGRLLNLGLLHLLLLLNVLGLGVSTMVRIDLLAVLRARPFLRQASTWIGHA